MIDAAVAENPIEKWLLSRRKALEEWKRVPPHGLGLAILLAVSIEFVLAYRLYHGVRLNASAISSTVNTMIFIAAIEMGTLLITNSVASLFNKRGRILTSFTSMNVSLLPLLLFLPATFFFWAVGGGAVARLLVLLVLIMKVLSDWKEVVRVNYLLSGIQVYMLGGVIGGAAYVLIILFLVLSGFGVIVESLTQIGLR